VALSDRLYICNSSITFFGTGLPRCGLSLLLYKIIEQSLHRKPARKPVFCCDLDCWFVHPKQLSRPQCSFRANRAWRFATEVLPMDTEVVPTKPQVPEVPDPVENSGNAREFCTPKTIPGLDGEPMQLVTMANGEDWLVPTRMVHDV
jgi:hypothetical protein